MERYRGSGLKARWLCQSITIIVLSSSKSLFQCEMRLDAGLECHHEMSLKSVMEICMMGNAAG